MPERPSWGRRRAPPPRDPQSRIIAQRPADDARGRLLRQSVLFTTVRGRDADHGTPLISNARRVLTILANPSCAIAASDKLVDTPGPADFGGEVYAPAHGGWRLLLVDASGAVAADAFVLRKRSTASAADRRHNKIYRTYARPLLLNEIYDLFIDLVPTTPARFPWSTQRSAAGTIRRTPSARYASGPLFDPSRAIPAPSFEERARLHS